MTFNSDRIDSVALAGGLNILFTLAGIMVLGALLMMAGVAMTFWHFVAAFIISQAICFGSCTRRVYVRSVVVVGLLWIATGVFASFLADSNYDSNSHHQEMMLTLIRFPEGYNYYSFDTPPDYLKLWTYTYPKGMEFICAPLTALTGNVETGKASMMMLFFGTMFLVWGVLQKMFPQWNGKRMCCVMLLVVSNPIVIYELFWLKDDSPLYYFPLLTILFSWMIIKGIYRRTAYFGLAAVIVLAVSVKLNQFFYEGITVLAVMAYMILFRQAKELKRYFFVAAGVALFAALVLNFHPYVTNTVLYGHPFYPLMGKGKVDIMICMMPEGITSAMSRLESFIFAHLCFHSNMLGVSGGSFCMFAPLIFILTFFMLVMNQVKIRKFTSVSYMVATVILSSFIFKECWWGRYVGFLWMLVPLAYIVWINCDKWWARCVRALLIVLCTINAIIPLVYSGYSCLQLTAQRRAIGRVLEGNTVTVYNQTVSGAWQMRELGINTVQGSSIVSVCDSITSDSLVPFYFNNYQYFPVLQVSPGQKHRIDSLTCASPQVRAWRAGVEGFHALVGK